MSVPCLAILTSLNIEGEVFLDTGGAMSKFAGSIKLSRLPTFDGDLQSILVEDSAWAIPWAANDTAVLAMSICDEPWQSQLQGPRSGT